MTDLLALSCGSLGLLGLALALAASSDACYLRYMFRSSWCDAFTYQHRRLLGISMGLVAVGLLPYARSAPSQLSWAFVVILYAAWLAWRLTRSTAKARQPADACVPDASVPQTTDRPLGPPVPPLVVWAEALAPALAAPFLWFPTVRPQGAVLALVLLFGVWLCSVMTTGVLWPRSRYDLALVLLLLMAGLGSLRSAVPTLTLPKMTGLMLGLASYRVLTSYCRTPRSALYALYAMAGLALLFALVGLAAGELRGDKIPAVAVYRTLLPRFVEQVPETQGGVISTNQLGGSLLYVLPVLSALVCAPRRKTQDPGMTIRGSMLVFVIASLLLVSLILTQSRGAWFGMFVGLLCILSLRWPWGKWVAILCLALPLTAWLLRAELGMTAFFSGVFLEMNGLSALSSLTGRLQLWAATVGYIRSFPLMGGGLGTFRILGASITSKPSVFDIGLPHAHNIFLQVAFDTGLPGLVAYVAMLFLAVYTSWHLVRASQGLVRSLALGCLAALVASTVYGMGDVVALGAKPGVLWWGLLALIAVLDRLAPLRSPWHSTT